MIYHLLYISEKSLHFKDNDVDDILTVSQRKNSQKELTGMLINNGSFFIQLLEGKRENVQSTFNLIKSDPRHSKVRVLMDYTDQNRIFPDWSMGLVEQDKNEESFSTLIPLLHTDIMKLQGTKEKMISILRKFNRS